MNNAAYSLAGQGRLDEDVVAACRVDLYPKEANLYDTLGEFQLRKGEKAKALESYQKALDLDPNFANAAAAREVVKKLTEELARKQ